MNATTEPAALRAAQEIESEWDLNNGATEPQQEIIAEIINRETGLPEILATLEMVRTVLKSINMDGDLVAAFISAGFDHSYRELVESVDSSIALITGEALPTETNLAEPV